MSRSHERRSPNENQATATLVPVPAMVGRGELPRFCALVAQALGCHRCWIKLAGPDGDVLIEDVFDEVHRAGPTWSDLTPALTEDVRIAHFPSHPSSPPERIPDLRLAVALSDGTTGEVIVADRADGRPFGAKDEILLKEMVRFYVATYDDTIWREVRRLRAEVKDMRREATSIAERERDRLARELHDDIGHAITTAIFGLDSKAEAVRAGSVEHEAMVAAREVLAACADHVQEFAFHLRPRVLDDLGLVPALRGLARRVQETTGVLVVVTVEGDARRLGEETELTAFRVVQEALTNALKHAHATLITVSVVYATFGLEVEVRDDGQGFAAGRAGEVTGDRGVSGQGLAGMRERVQLAGGVLEVDSEGGAGTAVWTRLPFLEAKPC